MPAKKAAKKAATKSHHPRPARHLRSAYEHLGRVEILESALAGPPFRDVTALATLAQQQLAGGHASEAASLLRAAEHLTFAALAPHNSSRASETRVSPDLKAAIAAEFEELIDRARHRRKKEHQNPRNTARNPGSQILSALYASTLEHARSAYDAAAYRPALELARAAEAICHIAADGAANAPASVLTSDRLIQLLAS